jgi:hypothetical protein
MPGPWNGSHWKRFPGCANLIVYGPETPGQ